MNKITFVSTIHKEHGKCNAEELYENVLKEINPDIIFLEALSDTYSRYEMSLFENFNVFQN